MKKLTHISLISILILSQTFTGTLAFSDDSGDFTQKCNYSIDSPAPTAEAMKMAGTPESCTAAQASYKTWKKAEPVGAAWTVVAATCLTSCITSQLTAGIAAPATEAVCLAAGVSTTALEAAQTENLGQAAAGMVMPLIGVITQVKRLSDSIGKYKAQSAAQEAAKKAAKETAKEAAEEVAEEVAKKTAEKGGKKGLAKAGDAVMCMMPVAMAASQAGMKFAAANNAKEMFKKQLASINPANTTGGVGVGSGGDRISTFGSGSTGANLTSAAGNASNMTPGGGSGGTPSGGNASAPTAGSGALSGNSTGAVSTNNANTPCGSTSTSGKSMSCAVSLDPKLPTALADPRFETDFSALTGKNLQNFLEETKDMAPKDAILASVSGQNFPGELTSALASGLGQIQENSNKQLLAENPNAILPASTLSSGGGGRSSGSDGSGMPPFDAIMQNMMAQFMPQMGGPATEKDKAIAMIIFANQKYSPTAIMENRGLNIFDRITFRYLVVGKAWYSR